MLIVEKIRGNLNGDAKIDRRTVDYVDLRQEDLPKTHCRLTSRSGRVLGLSLPQGFGLADGDILYEKDGIAIAVSLLEEDVLEITPASRAEWAITAFNIGNMHHSIFLTADSILTAYDGAVERLLQAIGVAYERKQRKLNGMRASAQMRQNHSHGGHSHGI